MKEKDVKLGKNCTKAERLAILEYCRSAHPSNVPDDIENAHWIFHARKGELKAGLFVR